MELLLGIFFALWWKEARQASARLFVATTIQRAGEASQDGARNSLHLCGHISDLMEICVVSL